MRCPYSSRTCSSTRRRTASATSSRPRSRSTGSRRSASTPGPWENYGYDELIESGLPREEIVWKHINLNACRELGITGRSRSAFLSHPGRRPPARERHHARARPQVLRRPAPRQERGRDGGHPQVAEGGRGRDGRARDLIFRAEPANGGVKVDGETLTSERLKAEIRRVFSEHGGSGDDFIVSHGRRRRSVTSSAMGRLLPTSRS